MPKNLFEMCRYCTTKIVKDTAGDWFHWSTGSIYCNAATGRGTEAAPKWDKDSPTVRRVVETLQSELRSPEFDQWLNSENDV